VDLDTVVLFMYGKIVKDLQIEDEEAPPQNIGEAEHRVANIKAVRDFTAEFKTKFQSQNETKELVIPEKKKKTKKNKTAKASKPEKMSAVSCFCVSCSPLISLVLAEILSS